MPRRVAFLTMENPEGFCSYDHLAVEPLRCLGWEVSEVPWSRRPVVWQDYDAVVIRSPWDYQQAPAAFLEVLETIERSGTPLWNGLDVVRWNIHKSYLRDLRQRGIDIVPTRWLNALAAEELAACFEAFQTDTLVVKPIVGANADDTFRVPRDGGRAVRDSALSCLGHRECLVQPFVPSVVELGEYSLFYFRHEYSHAIMKQPAAGDFRVQEEHGGLIRAVVPTAELHRAAERAVNALPFPTLYARIDLVRLADGTPAVMEVELIEPSLYFAFDEASPGRFAAAFDRCLRAG